MTGPKHPTAIAPITEGLAHDLARSSPGRIELSTRLTRANIMHSRISGTRLNSGSPNPSAAAMLTCRNCGIPLTGSARKLCSTCWPLIRDAEFKTRSKAAHAGLAAAREAGVDPSRTPEALAKRRQSALVRMVGSGAGAVTLMRSVSSPRPSNRACGSPAHGSRRRRPASGYGEPWPGTRLVHVFLVLVGHGGPLLGGVLADAQHLPHGRCQAGDRHSNSTKPGSTSHSRSFGEPARPPSTTHFRSKSASGLPSSRSRSISLRSP
jgi:hypothetical protein